MEKSYVYRYRKVSLSMRQNLPCALVRQGIQHQIATTVTLVGIQGSNKTVADRGNWTYLGFLVLAYIIGCQDEFNPLEVVALVVYRFVVSYAMNSKPKILGETRKHILRFVIYV